MLHKCFGGIHPAGRKSATQALAVEPLTPPPARLFLPVQVPLVAVGERVLLGTRLCKGDDTHPAIHASASGVVTAIELCRQSDGGEARCVVLQNDGRDAPAPTGTRAHAEALPASLVGEDICQSAAWAGLGGMGGACRPTATKLAAARGVVDTLVVNGCESESYLTADHRLIIERTADLLTGVRLLAKAVGVERAIVAVAGDKYDAVTALRALLPLRGGDVEIRVLRARYPQGAERQLVQKITGRQVPAGGTSAQVGCVVFNVATAVALTDGVYEGKPLTHRIVTVSGGAVANPKNLLVPMGTPIADLIAAAGGFAQPPERVLAGGGMMGVAQRSLVAPITQGVGGVVAMTRGEVKSTTQVGSACLRCGRCVEVCPMKLEPLQLYHYAKAENWKRVERLHLADCMECGACAYVCPAKIRLVGELKAAKEQMESREVATHGG